MKGEKAGEGETKIFVRKRSGEVEPYDPRKVERSCIKAGAPRNVAEEIVKEIEGTLYDGITTEEIYNEVSRLLDQKAAVAGLRYKLKEAIMKLGPEGFPFETFFAKLLNRLGYETKLRVKIKGFCAVHEVDVVAEKEANGRLKRCMIECKYHNSLGIYTGLKEALYTYARFLDLTEGWESGLCEKFDEAWLVTNTKFSKEAKEYGECKGLKMVGWNYPPGRGMEALLEAERVYPVTILRRVGKEEIRKLAAANLMTVDEVFAIDGKKLAKILELPEGAALKLKEEAEALLLSKPR